jgi:hypothetical protein
VSWLVGREGRQSHESGGQARQSDHSVRGEGRALAAWWPGVARRRRGGGGDIGSGRSGVRDGRWHMYSSGVIREILAQRDPWLPAGYGGGAWTPSPGVGARSTLGLLVVGVEMSG